MTIKGGCAVYDIDMDAACNTTQGIRMRVDGKEKRVAVRPEDYVLVTNGSLMTNSTFGDNTQLRALRKGWKTVADPVRLRPCAGLYRCRKRNWKLDRFHHHAD